MGKPTRTPQENITRRDQIMSSYGLRMVIASLCSRENVSRVIGNRGKALVLKTSNIDPHQAELTQLSRDMQRDKLSFHVPDIIVRGKDFLISEHITGDHLQDFYDQNSELCINLAKRICDDYQRVVQRFLSEQKVEDKLTAGRTWLASRLRSWGQHIVDARLLDPEDLAQLEQEFSDLIDKKGADMFGWCHGNIHGEHVIIDDKKRPYVLDLTFEARPGNGYYDFLRFLDHLFLVSHQKPQKLFEMINDAIKKHLAKEDQAEVRLVFAFRCIGVLGQDILNNPQRQKDPRMEAKFPYLVKWIKRGY